MPIARTVAASKATVMATVMATVTKKRVWVSWSVTSGRT
jgi:hypothetical protein